MSLSQKLRAHSSRGDELRRRLQITEIADQSNLLEETDSVGGALRAARLRLGLDVPTVAQELKIKREHIEALEEGDLKRLPAKAYALGFVRSYAVCLRLDPDECVRRFKMEHRAEDTPPKQPFTFPESNTEGLLPQGSLLILAAFVGVGIYAGWYMSMTSDQVAMERVPPVPQRLAEATAPSLAPEAEAIEPATAPQGLRIAEAPVRDDAAGGPSLDVGVIELGDGGDPVDPIAEPALEPDLGGIVAPDAEPENLAALVPEGAKVFLRARQTTWVRVEDSNNRVLIQQDLEEGQGYAVPDEPGLILSVRDAGALEVIVDGQPVGLLGQPGQALPAVSLDTLAQLAGRAS